MKSTFDRVAERRDATLLDFLVAAAAADDEPSPALLLARVKAVSEELERRGTITDIPAAEAIGLHRLRDALDSHILAAEVLVSSDASAASILHVLHRGVRAVAAGLPVPDTA